MLLFGWKYGVFIGLVDMLKAYIPVLVMLSFYPENLVLATFAGGGVIGLIGLLIVWNLISSK